MRRFAAVLVAMLMAACDDPSRAQREAQAAKKQREDAERSARYKAEREAEAALFADPKTAEEAINRRIDPWITRKDELLLVRGTWSISQRPMRANLPWHSMPRATPWFVECGRSGLSVHLGSWETTSGTPEEGIGSGNVFGLTVAFAPFSDEQCQQLVVITGKKMLTLTAAGERP
jgi:hypothetical protein